MGAKIARKPLKHALQPATVADGGAVMIPALHPGPRIRGAEDFEFRVFICFSSKDEIEARQIVEFLEGEGLRCWISLRDVAPGENYQEVIVRAIETACGVVFLFSGNSNDSGEIKKELALADSCNIPVFPVRLSRINPNGALRYELATRQWVDIFVDRDKGLSTLASTVRTVLAYSRATESAASLAPAPTAAPSQASPKSALLLESDQFEAIRILLAPHIGPVAKLVIRKAASDATTPEDFCQKLAGHVGEPSDRAKFLAAVETRLLAKP